MSSEPPPIPGARDEAGGGSAVVPAFTFVVWVGCVVTGVVGLIAAPATPPPRPTTEPITQVVSVSLDAAPVEAAAAPQAVMAPPMPASAVPDELPATPIVAAPTVTAAATFAAPVSSPIRSTSASPAGAATVVRAITFGRGEGDQPAPVYPDAARAAGQQGTVVVRFSIGTDGRIADARVVTPSPFPLLNAAAADAVRDTWQYGPGPPRVYEVPITFRLN